MRRLGLACLAAVSLAAFAPSLAAAQDINGSGSPMADLQDLNRFATRGFMNQWSATRPARLSGLSPAGKTWLKKQVERQALTPAPPPRWRSTSTRPCPRTSRNSPANRACGPRTSRARWC